MSFKKGSDLKILLTLPNFRTAGSQFVLLSLYHQYKKFNYKTLVLIEDKTAHFPDEVDMNDRVVLPKAGYLGLFDGIRYSFALAKKLKENKISVVHSWDYRSEIWEALACKLSRVPYVFTKKNNAWSRRWWLKSFLATHIVYDHPGMLDRFFKSRRFRRKATFIPHGVNTEVFHPSDLPRTPKQVIGCIGNIGPNKNQLTLLKALTKCRVPLTCRFYGNSDAKYLQSMQDFIREHQLSDRISIHGFAANKDLPAIIKEFDILILASYNEGLPVILLEAMACGVYCIASHSGGGSEFILNSCSSGGLFDPDDADQLARMLDGFYSDPEPKQKSAREAVDVIKDRFSVHREGKQYLELFAGLCNV